MRKLWPGITTRWKPGQYLSRMPRQGLYSGTGASPREPAVADKANAGDVSDYWRECAGFLGDDAFWSFADDTADFRSGEMGCEHRRANSGHPALAHLDLELCSYWDRSYPAQHVVPVEPGSIGGAGVRPLDLFSDVYVLRNCGKPRQPGASSQSIRSGRIGGNFRFGWGAHIGVLSWSFAGAGQSHEIHAEEPGSICRIQFIFWGRGTGDRQFSPCRRIGLWPGVGSGVSAASDLATRRKKFVAAMGVPGQRSSAACGVLFDSEICGARVGLTRHHRSPL